MKNNNHDHEMMPVNPMDLMMDMGPKRIWVREFNAQAAETFTNQLFDCYEEDSQAPILVFIDSSGGELDALSAMVSAMDSVPNPLVTIAMGHAQSSGALLLSHGDIRCVAPHSRIMVHEVSAGTIGNVNDMHTEVNEIKRLNEYWMAWLANNCSKTLKELNNFFGNHRREVYLNAQGAIDFGIADKIGIPFLSTQNVKNYEMNFNVKNYEVNFLETKSPVVLPKPPKKKSKK